MQVDQCKRMREMHGKETNSESGSRKAKAGKCKRATYATPKKTRRYKCPECPLSVVYKASLKKHMERKHAPQAGVTRRKKSRLPGPRRERPADGSAGGRSRSFPPWHCYTCISRSPLSSVTATVSFLTWTLFHIACESVSNMVKEKFPEDLLPSIESFLMSMLFQRNFRF